MEDSFFGFDTSMPLDDDGSGQIAEPSEEEYDALNDETFGSATNGDWEEAHENLVRLGSDRVRLGSRRRDEGNDSIDSVGGANRYGRIPSAASSGGSTPAHLDSRLRNSKQKHMGDSDLELNLSGMKLDDVDMKFDDNESNCSIGGDRITLDPSVWAANSFKSVSDSDNCLSNSHQNLFREQYRNTFLQPQQKQHPLMIRPELNANYGMAVRPPAGPNFATLEDIERNLIIQQALQKQRQQHEKDQKERMQHEHLKQQIKTPTPTPIHHQNQHMQQHNLHKPHPQQQQLPQQQHQQPKAPPGFPASTQASPPRPSANFLNNLAQHSHSLGNLLQQPNVAAVAAAAAAGSRLPPGFPIYPPGMGANMPGPSHIHSQHMPPHPLMNQHAALNPNFPLGHQRPLPNSHLPIALNNFAMHPNFNPMRAAAGAAAGIHPAALMPQLQQPQRLPHLQPPHHPPVLNPHQPNSMNNMFNMRLVQEIQQNHPLLQNVARQAQHQQLQYQHQMQQHMRCGNGRDGGKQHLQQQQQYHRRNDNGTANGNLPHEIYDEYANLMSTRDKHWLIGIQLSQLNTDTPYIDDYYYTVYKERKALQSGNLRHSQAHKDNQLNHPLTQPKGHAQLVLVQLGNKNGTRDGSRNPENHNGLGMNGSSNNTSLDQKLPYVYTPLKFENSLGKLQYGSVTAPRKIIDADIMNSDANTDNVATTTKNVGGSNSNLAQAKALGLSTSTSGMSAASGDLTPSTQRKSRQILLHIEILFRFVLKLEDLEIPNAIATIIMKKKRESERIAALEQMENANKTPEERAAEANNGGSINPALKNKFAYEIEPKETLVAKLAAGLTNDKVIAMMNVRKGKVLIRRIMPFIEDKDIRWNVWAAVFSSLQNVIRKDREDPDGLLYALFPEFTKQVVKADFETVVKLATAITLYDDKKLSEIIHSKFGLSSLVCLINHAENLFAAKKNPISNDVNKQNWRQFVLHFISNVLNYRMLNRACAETIGSDSLQIMLKHFTRFQDAKTSAKLSLDLENKLQQMDK